MSCLNPQQLELEHCAGNVRTDTKIGGGCNDCTDCCMALAACIGSCMRSSVSVSVTVFVSVPVPVPVPVSVSVSVFVSVSVSVSVSVCDTL